MCVCFEFQMPNKAFRHLFFAKRPLRICSYTTAFPARKWSFMWVKWVKANIIPSFPTCCSSSNPLIWCISKLSWWLSSLQEKKEHEEETKMLIAREFELRAERARGHPRWSCLRFDNNTNLLENYCGHIIAYLGSSNVIIISKRGRVAADKIGV